VSVDQTQTVKVKVEGDTASARAAMQALAQETKRTASSFDKMRDGFNKNIDGIMTGLAKFNLAMQGIGTIIDGLGKAAGLARLNAEMRNMEKTLPINLIVKLQNATDGAVTKLDLMRFSMKALHGELALTEDGLKTVLKAADTLGDQGFGDTMEIAEKLTSVIRTGNVKSLKELGIELDVTADKQANVNQALRAMQDLAATPVNVDPQLMAIEKMQTATQDWVNDMGAGLGFVFGWAFKKVGELTDELAGIGGTLQMSNEDIREEAMRAAVDEATQRIGNPYNNDLKRQHSALVSELFGQNQRKLIAQRAASVEKRKNAEFRPAARNLWDRAWGGGPDLMVGDHAKAGKGRGLLEGGDADFIHGDELMFMAGADGTDRDGLMGLGAESERDTGDDLMEMGEFSSKEIAQAEAMAKQAAALAGIMADLADKTTLAGGAYDVFGSAILAAGEAAMEGSDGIGRAALAAAAASLKGIAKESAVKALYETAGGFASIAVGDAKGATGHFAAAGQYALTAVAAGVAGAALAPSGGAGSPSSAPGGGFASGSSGGSQASPQTIIVQVGDGFVGKPRELAEAIDEVVRSGTRSGRVREESGVVKVTT
jgi:hypothetical protein